jgi:hypothetical protein
MISIEEANRILGLRLGNRSADSVNTWYVGVSTTSISEDGSGISEPSDSNGYHRVAIQNNSSNFTSPANMTVKNTNPIVFDEVTADCGTVTDIFLSDVETGGKAAYYGKFTIPRPMPAQSNLTINAGDASFKIVNIK